MLYLSTRCSKEANAGTLMKYIQSLAVPVSAATNSPAMTPLQPPLNLDIFLHVHDATRNTFLDHARSLYGTALGVSATLAVDVIPTLHEYQEGEEATSSSLPQLLDSTMMQSPAVRDGFQPLYTYVAVGGTFDHLHAGHKLLLSTALLHTTERLRVGVTGTELLTQKKHKEAMQSIAKRMEGVRTFLTKIRHDVALEIETIHDMCGGTDTIAAIEALAVSPDTQKSLQLINEIRAQNGGLPPMALISIPYIQSADGTVLSSTALRHDLQRR